MELPDLQYMEEALELARAAAAEGEVPVGAVVVHEGQVVARGRNRRERDQDFAAHAEFLAMREAAQVLGSWRLEGCTVYVTLEPCPMCAGAIVHCRLRRVIFGCPDEKGGAAGGLLNLLQHPSLNHACEITPTVMQDECLGILQSFFRERRQAAKDSG